MTDYISAAEFKSRHGITVATNDARIAEHVTAASRKVDALTSRQFGPHSGAATVRYFAPSSCSMVWVDDTYEITSVEVDGADTGTYSEAWTVTTHYETNPANGIGPDGQSGWPIATLVAVAGLTFPTYNRRRSVKVTAKWGWAAVPAAVKEATYLLAHRLYFEVSVPGGITTPNPEFGIPGAPLLRPYTAEGLLKPYARADSAIGIA
jgi:hypothetical protein